MNVLESALRRIASDLDHLGRRWALVGGFAVSARAEPRFTRDLDLAIAVSDDLDAEELVHALVGGDHRLVGMIEHEPTGRLATVRLSLDPQSMSGGVVVDALFASSGIEPDIVEAAEILEIVPGLSVRVASTGHLIALELLARDDLERPQDLADLRALLRVADDSDLAAARSGCDLIVQRGFGRGRDLVAALEALASE